MRESKPRRKAVSYNQGREGQKAPLSPQEAAQGRAMRSGVAADAGWQWTLSGGSSHGWRWLGEGLRQQAGSGLPSFLNVLAWWDSGGVSQE